MNAFKDLIEQVQKPGAQSQEDQSSKPDPKALSDSFYQEQHARTLEMQSFQILSQCFHPGLLTWDGKALAQGEYVVMLEQLYLPKKTAELKAPDKQKLQPKNFGIQDENDMFEEEEDFDDDNDEDETALKKGEIRYEQRDLSSFQRINFSLSPPVRANYDESSFNRQSSAQSSRMQQQATWKNNKTSKQLTVRIDKPTTLKAHQTPSAANLTTYKISIWKIDQEEQPLIMAEQRFQIAQEVYVLGNKLSFSQDGKYIFLNLLLDNEQRTLWKCISFDAQTLQHSFDIDLTKVMIKEDWVLNAFDIKNETQMIKLKDEFMNLIEKNQQPIQKSVHPYVLCFQEKTYIVIVTANGQFFVTPRVFEYKMAQIVKIKGLFIGIDENEEKMLFLCTAKTSQDDKRPKVTAYLPSIDKTFQKMFLNELLSFQDEKIYQSSFTLIEESAPTKFQLKQVHFNRDHGLFLQLKNKNLRQEISENLTHLFYLPRTSLFSGKDQNQVYYTFANFFMPQNFHLSQQQYMMAHYELYPHIFNVKDMIRGNESQQNIFENRGTEVVRQKFMIKSPNLLDFKMCNQQLCITNFSDDIYEIPIVSYLSKAGQNSRNIEKYQLFNINPYIVVLEDRSLINIYSMINQDQHHSFKIQDCKCDQFYLHFILEFLQFIELARGTLDFSGKYYKHQICLYLTMNQKGKMRINCLILPRYDQESKVFKALEFPFIIDWGEKQRSSSIIKATLVQFSQKNNEINMKLVIQLFSKILVYNLATGQVKSFPSNSQVQILLQHLDDAVSSDLTAKEQLAQILTQPVIFYVSSQSAEAQTNGQIISQLEIDPVDSAKMYPVLEFNGPQAIKLQQICGQALIVIDESLQIKKFKMQTKTMKMKLLDDFRVSEEARKILIASNNNFCLTNDSLYFKRDFFLMMKKQSQNNESLTDFEIHREKQVHYKLTDQTFCFGPVLSQDRQNLIYIYKSNKSYRQQVLQNLSRQQQVNSSSKHDDEQTLKKAYKIIDALLKLRERKCQPKPTENRYSLLQIPLLTQNSQSVVHKDDFIIDAVELSTFTPENDVLLKLMDNTFLVFDIHGNQLNVQLDSKIEIKGFTLTQCQLVSQNFDESVNGNDFIAFVFENMKSNIIKVLKVKKIANKQSYQISYLHSEIKIIDPEAIQDLNYKCDYRQTRLEGDGNIYQLVIFQLKGAQNKRQEIVLTKNGKSMGRSLDIKISQIFQKQTNRDIKKPHSAQVNLANNSGNAMTELLLQPENREDEIFFDYDFHLLPLRQGSNIQLMQYFLFKRDLDLYYFNLKNLSNQMVLDKVELDLDHGMLTQIVTTGRYNVVQFVYAQAKPLQHFVFSWDLERNIQIQMNTFTPSIQIPYVYLSRGITTRENYFIPANEDQIYDMRFSFPLNQLNGADSQKGHQLIQFNEKLFKRDFDAYNEFLMQQVDSHKDEYKIAGQTSALLGFSQQRITTIQFPHTYLQLQYAQYIIDLYKEKPDEKQKFKPILEFLKISLQYETNILHVFALDETFLQSFTKEIRTQLIDLGDKKLQSFIYWVLLPMNKSTQFGRRPFSIAINQFSPKCLEYMLEMLTFDRKSDYMRYVERYILQLLEMKSTVFYNFFDTCCMKFQFRMPGSLLSRDAVYLRKQTQYINQAKFMQTFEYQVQENSSNLWQTLFFCGCMPCGKKRAKKIEVRTDIDETMEIERVQDTGKLQNNDNALSDDEQSVYNNQEKKAAINFYSYEFDHILKGQQGQQLIKYLSQQQLNSPLLQSPTVHAYLDSQWQIFKWQYFMIIALYIISFLIMFPYFHLVKSSSSQLEHLNFTQNMNQNKLLYFFLIPIQFGVSLYLTYFETKKLIATGDKLQIFIILYNSFQILMPMIDIIEEIFGESLNRTFSKIWRALQYGINANFMMMGLLVLLYKIKYLNIANFYITRLFLVISQIYPLLLLIFASQITFSYAYKIIYEIDLSHKEGFGIIFKSFNYFFEETYQTLWELYKKQSAGADEVFQDQLIFFFLLILTLVVISTNILLTYFLIASIIDSYNKVSINIKNQKYLARSKILFENSLLFRREEVFKSTRYIIKAQGEKIKQDDKNGDLENLTSAITSSVKTTVEQEAQKTEATFKFMKNRLVKLGSNLEQIQQVIDLQQTEVNRQLQQMMRYLGDLSGRSTTAMAATASIVQPQLQMSTNPAQSFSSSQSMVVTGSSGRNNDSGSNSLKKVNNKAKIRESEFDFDL